MQSGDVIAERFEVERLSAAGGMGRVYRALDRLSGQTVALKVLYGAGVFESERFAREAQVLATLRHPGIVRYIAYGTTDAGEPYLVLEWLDGETLLDRLRRQGLALAESLALGARLAAALGEVHKRGVVHRDLKPSNVLLCGRSPEQATLIDFGIARLTSAGQQLTLPGGMTRVAGHNPETGGESISMQRGGASMDTWVLTEGPVDTFSMLPSKLSVDDLAARHRPVSSRTGENLFWLGRYTERTEQLVRLARATLMLIDADADADEATQAALSSLAVTTGLAPWGVPTLAQAPHLFERAVLDALADVRGGRSSSVAYNLSRLASASAALRERLSSEQWGLIRTMGDSFALALEAPPGQLPALPQVLPALDRLTVQLAAVTGMQTDRMTRDHGWRLLAVGRLIERLIGLAQRLEVFETTGALASPAGTDVLLELFDSTITFRARYQRREDLLAIIDLLVLDTNNPRAFGGVLRRLRTELSKLPGTREQIDALQALLPREGAGLALESLRGLDDAAVSARLLALARHLAASAMQLSDRIGERYFTLAHGHVQAV